MNFGVRLPGPFRAGMSSKGRMSVGATLGPFSVSTGVGGGRPANPGQAFYPISLEGAVAELAVHGWVPTYCDQRTALMVEHVPGRLSWLLSGWNAVRIDAAEGGVTWEPITSRRKLAAKAIFWTAVGVGLLALCGNVTS